ncbi:MAG: ArsR family transcriptional regulator [Candidatus ainarchaeum sp.]|nr:ArsR family transcriptional regulator [Candidatus ainarchaeum sp.]
MANDLIKQKTNNSLSTIKTPSKKIQFRTSKFKINIRKITLEESSDFDEKFAWVCASLGFFEKIDKQKNAAKIFKEIFLASSIGQVLTSTTISQKVKMSRGSTINHLNNLVNSGLIEKGGKYYFTRQKTMKGIINEIENDATHIFSRMKKIAEEIDKETNKVIIM